MSFPSVLLVARLSQMPVALLLVPSEWLAVSDTPGKTTLNLQDTLHVGRDVTRISVQCV